MDFFLLSKRRPRFALKKEASFCSHKGGLVLLSKRRPRFAPKKEASFCSQKGGLVLLPKRRPRFAPKKEASFCSQKGGLVLLPKRRPFIKENLPWYKMNFDKKDKNASYSLLHVWSGSFISYLLSV